METKRNKVEHPERELEQKRLSGADKAAQSTENEEDDKRAEDEDEEIANAEEQELADDKVAVAQFESLAFNIEHVLRDGVDEIPQELPLDQQHALHLLFQAATGVDEFGIYASGGVRMRFFNRALATLAPRLSAVRNERLAPRLAQRYLHLQETISRVRTDIRTRIKVEAHSGGRKRSKKQLGADRAGLSPLGALCLDLALLIKNRKRPELDYDPVEYPIVTGIDRLWDDLLALGKIAAEIVRLDERRIDAADGQKAELDGAIAGAVERLAETLAGALARCKPGAEPPDPGAFEAIARPLGSFAGRGSGAQGEAAAKLALDFVRAAVEVIDGAETSVGGAGKKERGLLGRIFGRGKKEE